MRIFAFSGPSLTPDDRSAFANIIWLPPAQAGDLLSLKAVRGDRVCLIDGYFDHRPSVRHKEILYLLARGVSIFGAASMGALRAAEMRSVGMRGVGAIYRGFADSRLTGDDEVALVHGPEEWDWKALTLPLVDCRAAIHRALRTRFLDSHEARLILFAATMQHFSEREWSLVLRESSLPVSRQLEIDLWVAENCVSQKRLDALACIEAAIAVDLNAVAAPEMIWTSLVTALARERGLNPDQMRQLEAAHQPTLSVPFSGKDGGTEPIV